MTIANIKRVCHWAPNTFRDLLGHLELSSSCPPSSSRHLLELLEEHSTSLKDLLYYPKPEPAHRVELQRGSVRINGVLLSCKITPREIASILAISDELDIDEHLAATIYSHFTSLSSSSTLTNPEHDSSYSLRVTTCVKMFYQERYSKLKCWEYIVTHAAPQEGSGSKQHPLQSEFLGWLSSVLVSDAGFIQTILFFLSQLHKPDYLNRELSASILPYFQASAGSGIDENDVDLDKESIIRFRFEETQLLCRVYHILFQTQLIKLSDALNLLLSLKEMSSVDLIFHHLLVTWLTFINNLTNPAWLNQIYIEMTANYCCHWNVEPARYLSLGALGLVNLANANQTPQHRDNLQKLIEANHELVYQCLLKGGLAFAVNYLFPVELHEKALTRPIMIDTRVYKDNTEPTNTHNNTNNIRESVDIKFLSLPENLSSTLTTMSKKVPNFFEIQSAYLCERQFFGQLARCFEIIIHRLLKLGSSPLNRMYQMETFQMSSYPTHNSSIDVNISSDTDYSPRNHSPPLKHFPHQALCSLISLVLSCGSNGSWMMDGSSWFIKLIVLNAHPLLSIAGLDLIRCLVSQVPSSIGLIVPLLNDDTSWFSWNKMNYRLKLLIDNQAPATHTNLTPNEIANDHWGMIHVSLSCYAQVLRQLDLNANSGSPLYTPLSQMLPMNEILDNLFNLLACPIPLAAKGWIFDAIGGYGRFANLNQLELIWKAIHHVLPLDTNNKGARMTQEVAELEMQFEVYPLTKGLLKCLLELVKSTPTNILTQESPRSVLKLVITNIAPTLFSRTYKYWYEQFELADCCLMLFTQLLTQFHLLMEPSLKIIRVDQPNTAQVLQLKDLLSSLAYHPGLTLISALLQGRLPLLKGLFQLLTGYSDLLHLPQSKFPYRWSVPLLSIGLLRQLIQMEHQGLIDELIPKLSSSHVTLRHIPCFQSLTRIQDSFVFLDPTGLLYLFPLTKLIQLGQIHPKLAMSSILLTQSLLTPNQSSLPTLALAHRLMRVVLSQPKFRNVVSWYFETLHYPPPTSDSSFTDGMMRDGGDLINCVLSSIYSTLQADDQMLGWGPFLLGFVYPAQPRSSVVQNNQLELLSSPNLPFHAILKLLYKSLSPAKIFADQGRSYETRRICCMILKHLTGREHTRHVTLQHLRDHYPDLILKLIHSVVTEPVPERPLQNLQLIHGVCDLVYTEVLALKGTDPAAISSLIDFMSGSVALASENPAAPVLIIRYIKLLDNALNYVNPTPPQLEESVMASIKNSKLIFAAPDSSTGLERLDMHQLTSDPNAEHLKLSASSEQLQQWAAEYNAWIDQLTELHHLFQTWMNLLASLARPGLEGEELALRMLGELVLRLYQVTKITSVDLRYLDLVGTQGLSRLLVELSHHLTALGKTYIPNISCSELNCSDRISRFRPLALILQSHLIDTLNTLGCHEGLRLNLYRVYMQLAAYIGETMPLANQPHEQAGNVTFLIRVVSADLINDLRPDLQIASHDLLIQFLALNPPDVCLPYLDTLLSSPSQLLNGLIEWLHCLVLTGTSAHSNNTETQQLYDRRIKLIHSLAQYPDFANALGSEGVEMLAGRWPVGLLLDKILECDEESNSPILDSSLLNAGAGRVSTHFTDQTVSNNDPIAYRVLEPILRLWIKTLVKAQGQDVTLKISQALVNHPDLIHSILRCPLNSSSPKVLKRILHLKALTLDLIFQVIDRSRTRSPLEVSLPHQVRRLIQYSVSDLILLVHKCYPMPLPTGASTKGLQQQPDYWDHLVLSLHLGLSCLRIMYYEGTAADTTTLIPPQPISIPTLSSPTSAVQSNGSGMIQLSDLLGLAHILAHQLDQLGVTAERTSSDLVLCSNNAVSAQLPQPNIEGGSDLNGLSALEFQRKRHATLTKLFKRLTVDDLEVYLRIMDHTLTLLYSQVDVLYNLTDRQSNPLISISEVTPRGFLIPTQRNGTAPGLVWDTPSWERLARFTELWQTPINTILSTVDVKLKATMSRPTLKACGSQSSLNLSQRLSKLIDAINYTIANGSTQS